MAKSRSAGSIELDSVGRNLMPATHSLELIARHSVDTIEIFRQDCQSALVTQRAQTDKRPYIHPLLAPDGVGVLTENEPPHHPWQHGLYVGLNDINGIGFWTEGRRGNQDDGTFHPQPLAAPEIA